MRPFDGINPPSDEAIDLLLHAMQTCRSMAPLHKLPLEVQDMILDEVSAGSIEKARMGCLLNAGSVFTWRYGNQNIETEEPLQSRTAWSPVESHIYYGRYYSGIAYR